jgi:flagellar motor component MotA
VFTSKATGLGEILRVVQKIIVPAGVFVSLFSIIMISVALEDITLLGPNLAVATLPSMYAIIVYIILIPINNRMATKS